MKPINTLHSNTCFFHLTTSTSNSCTPTVVAKQVVQEKSCSETCCPQANALIGG